MKSVAVITMNTSISSKNSVLDFIKKHNSTTISAYICISNVHMCMETFDSERFREVINHADMVIPDGRPIYWAQRLLGHKDAEQVRGQDVMNAICELSNTTEIKIGLYGGSSDEVLQQVITKLKNKYPLIKIVYSYAPPFRQLTAGEDEIVSAQINRSNVDILFVGIGCPKQEIWMAEHKQHLQCVMLGVGAAYDFIAGTKQHAPRWIQKIGLEWLFRLASEPKRLWKRYLKQNPRFIYHFTKQLIKHKLSSNKSVSN
jgi:N-acetylglucosaminyldiphosphoundecaprenol N-acetyl-beta-D-mannosaminyltransferase